MKILALGAAALALGASGCASTLPGHPRPDGFFYSLAGGLGAGVAQSSYAGDPAPSARGLAASGTATVGVATGDRFAVGLSGGALTAGGESLAGGGLRLAIFPMGTWGGGASDFNVFVDAGAALRIAGAPLVKPAGGLFLGGVGVGWEGWHAGPFAAGPFVEGKLARGTETLGMALLGFQATIYDGAFEAKK